MTACDVCGNDIFPRVSTREMGARCVTHATGTRSKYEDVRVYVDTLAARAVRDYYADRRAGVMPFYLYYRVGALCFAPDAPDATWMLAEPQTHRGAWTANQLTNHVRELARRLSILRADMV